MSAQSDDLDNRFTYHAPGPADPAVYQQIRGEARALAATIVTHTPQSREQSLAITALEEAVMWANAARARHGAPE